MSRLNKKFFERSTLLVARGLLGQVLVRKWRGKEIRAMICETEAYHGPKDLASHASRGITPRTRVMFGEAGRAYVYLIYGMHHCFNIVTGRAGYPAAVLIRGIIEEGSEKIISGPGRVAKFLHIDRRLNELDLCKNNTLWLECGARIPARRVLTGKRIGVDYAGAWKDKPWRFYTT
ncbi:MAG: DNA-3-methyladenine glycosylase [Candidatus Niyogibacteria bacterium]|nr:DNA-3-methyladenine glycosylase [Candidatus Niyogibacteria bacterium]